ncbi:nucleoside triphosphate pyrophosphohydrolase family protein [Bacillus cereus]
MTNVNKHGVDYSAIEIGDLVKLNMDCGETVLGYVTYIDGDLLEAIWSDDFEVYHESHLTGNVTGHWKVVVHEPKKLVPTKPYGQLISYISLVDGKEKWGLYTHTEGENIYCYWGRYYSEKEAKGYIPTDLIHRVVDVVVHEPKEQNLSAAQELSVQQESANFAHAAVQGIINAHAEKNNAKEINVQVMLPRFYSQEEYKKYGRDCYLQGQEDTEKRMISQNTLELAKEKAYSEGLNDAKRVALTFDDFDLSVRRTWKKQDFKDAVSNAALGLTGEAGEVADLIKKAVYHGRGFQPSGCDLPDNGEIDPDDVKDELSDVLFYVSAIAQEFGFTLEDVAKHNREKLEKRFPEGFSTEASAQKKDRAPEVKPKEVTD